MDLEFLTSVLMIVGIDVVLGGDNAIVIALASRNLPESKRNKAILIGTLLAIVLRIILTILAVYLLDIPFLQLIGGVLLTLIAVNLLTDNSNDLSSIQGKTTLFQAVRTIVFADLVMGFDNVIAIAGAAHGRFLLVIIGLLISIPIIIWGSKLILILMERFPFLIYCGAAILILQEKWLHMKTDLQPFFITIQVSLQAFLICSFSLFYASALSYNKFDYAM